MEKSIIGDYGQVNWLHRQEFIFLSDSQDANDVKRYLGNYVTDPRTGEGFTLENFNSFFVREKGGDYTEIWGMSGIIPYNNKEITRLK